MNGIHANRSCPAPSRVTDTPIINDITIITMLTNDHVRDAMNDPTLSDAEIEEIRTACNMLADIFLEYRQQSDLEN